MELCSEESQLPYEKFDCPEFYMLWGSTANHLEKPYTAQATPAVPKLGTRCEWRHFGCQAQSSLWMTASLADTFVKKIICLLLLSVLGFRCGVQAFSS